MLLVSSLEAGGAERQVVELMRHIDRDRFRPVVCSLSREVPLAGRLPDPDRELIVVEKRFKYDISTVWRTARIIRERGISVIHAFLFDAMMVARLAGRLARVPVIIDSERNSDYEVRRLHTCCLRMTRHMSHGLIANSRAGKTFSSRVMAIPEDSVFVVHNGVDAAQFEGGDGARVRRELGIAPDDPVVGMIAHFKPQKNHAMFFAAAERLLERFPRCWFLCVGEPLRNNVKGSEDYHRDMHRLLDRSPVGRRCKLLGARHDMPDVYAACDVTVLTSRHEGTPNVVLESMAAGVPVVATDVADNAYVVVDERTGYVVPLDDAANASDRVAALLADRGLRREMGRRARAWVESEFSVQAMVRRTEEVYTRLLDRWRVSAWQHDEAGAGRR